MHEWIFQIMMRHMLEFQNMRREIERKMPWKWTRTQNFWQIDKLNRERKFSKRQQAWHEVIQYSKIVYYVMPAGCNY